MNNFYKSKVEIVNLNSEELMKKSIFQKLTNWIVAAVFLVLVAGFSLLEQPSAKAQSLTPPVVVALQIVHTAIHQLYL